MLAPFDYHRPQTLADASALLRAYGDAAAVYAGGTELLPLLKDGLIEASHLIDVKAIPGLSDIERDDGGLRIGALATHRAIERSPLVREHLPALAALEANVANVRVRAAGTIGGNLCFAEPHSDPATLLVALDARFTLVSVDGAREIAAGDFFTGLLETARRPDELLADIQIPAPAAGSGVAYERFKTHERPSASVASVIQLNDGAVSDCRIVVGSVGPRPVRMRRAEGLLAGAVPSDELIAEAAEAIREEVEPTTDVFESTDYKRQLAATLGRRAIAAAVARAGGDGDDGR